MRILVTNDDGLYAPGLAHLVNVARAFGEVKVSAPDRQRSACGHGMTMYEPLRVKETELEGLEAYEVSGLPVDCVNVGMHLGWPDGCDLLLSGINNGPNLGFDVTYSGTVAGAMEGTINDIFSIAFSMAIFASDAPYHFETGARWIKENLNWMLSLPRKPLTLLNVNIPAIEFIELRGNRIVPTGKRVYEERVEERGDPFGRPYYWQGGVVVMNPQEQPDTDVEAVSEGFVSVTPITLDWTDYDHLKTLNEANRKERSRS